MLTLWSERGINGLMDAGHGQVPQKTQLYVDNATRECDNAIAMHRTFQRHLSRLKLLAGGDMDMSGTVAHSCVRHCG